MKKTQFPQIVLMLVLLALATACGGDSAANNAGINRTNINRTNTNRSSTNTDGNSTNAVTTMPTPVETPKNTNGSTAKKDEGLFSFPPPKPTDYTIINNQRLLNAEGQTSFAEIAAKLTRTLENAGYDADKYAYFWNGNEEFAIITKIERINGNGEIFTTSERWNDSTTLPVARDGTEYFNYLIDGKRTIYRVFAFIVTGTNYNFRRNTPPSFEMAKDWMNKGEPVLGAGQAGGVQESVFTDKHKCYALLYLFVNHTSLDNPKSVDKLEESEKYLIVDLNRETKTHLEKTNIKFGEN